MTRWREVKLGDVLELKRGYDLPRGSRRDGPVPVVSSSGPTGFHSEAKVHGPGVVTGRYGTLGRVYYITEDFWPLNTTLYVRDFKGNDPRYIAALLESMELAQYDGAAAVPGLNRNQLHTLRVRVPDHVGQATIAGVLVALDALFGNVRRQVEVLEEIARRIYMEWFVYFRFPGRENAKIVESQLGPVPEGWGVTTVRGLASNERNAVTGGPFGSKLGRKDYVDKGVPVIRGTNLRLGGGFDESGLVFVSEKKAGELRTSIARPGDIVVTQRGTLGQIGLIPRDAAFDAYLLSQSQMKITVDPAKTTPEFVYTQMRSPETTQRFVARAMSSGVPHVNLQLLRDFELISPPYDLQMRYSDHVRTLDSQCLTLQRQADCLCSMRDLLLPKLVTGQIDVSSLDLGAMVEVSVA